MRKVRENILVASGNLPLFAADQDVFACPAADRTGVTVNVLPGQIVVYDPGTQRSLGPTADLSTNDRIVVAVGVDTNGDGASNTLRKSFGEKIYGQYINAAHAEPPRCGTAPIVDVLYRCGETDEDYTIQVNVEDDSTQNTYPYNRPSSYTVTVKTDAGDCTDCDPDVFAGDIACKVVDAFNNLSISNDATQISTFKKPIPPQLPFTVHRLFSRSIVYCLDPLDDACGGCINIAGITGMDFEETSGSGVVNTTFNYNLNPTDSTLTMQAQLQNIVNQINTALGDVGTANITSGAGNCCPLQLEVNTCAFEFNLLDSAGGDMTACSEVDPLAAITVANGCRNCGDATTSQITYDGGIRFISKSVDLSCNCEFPPNPPIGFFGRKLDAFPSDGFKRGATFVRNTQPMALPQNLGYQWQWREYTSDNGGSGRGHNPYNDQVGPISLPYQNDRARGGKVDCKSDYCSYAIEHGLPHTAVGVAAPFRAAKGRTVVLIPSGDITTRTDWEALINNYIGSPSLPIKASMTCSSDQDQDSAFAGGTLTLTGQPLDTETVVVDGTTYTFLTVFVDAVNNVLIGSDASDSLDNLISAVNASPVGAAVAGTDYFTSQVAHTTASAAQGAGDTMVVTALTAGTAGNSIATTETLTNGSFAAVTLLGGLDSAVVTNPYPNANGYIL